MCSEYEAGWKRHTEEAYCITSISVCANLAIPKTILTLILIFMLVVLVVVEVELQLKRV